VRWLHFIFIADPYEEIVPEFFKSFYIFSMRDTEKNQLSTNIFFISNTNPLLQAIYVFRCDPVNFFLFCAFDEVALLEKDTACLILYQTTKY